MNNLKMISFLSVILLKMRIELEIIIKYFITDEYFRLVRSCSKTSSVDERRNESDI